ncbi:hypothetical protein MN116_008126 [Schistosoma mekongi]|uniref:Uncharacterized protein n=1 Tax=Schistosoma mekongi TaxID=38744 RepID=A0AAE1Z657_SCHME|nr:hypothetical protein MN116_008126 [Schistosoma mekongi]
MTSYNQSLMYNKDTLNLSSFNCQCDICQCFNVQLQNEQYFNMKYKLNDRVKLWCRYEGIVKFIGCIQFKGNIKMNLIGIELDKHISKITLTNYNLYCDNMKRILVPSSFITLLSSRRPTSSKISNFIMNPNYQLIQRNRKLYKTIDPLLYKLIFQR